MKLEMQVLLGQAQTCGRVKPVNGIPTPVDNWIYNSNTDKQTIKKNLNRFSSTSTPKDCILSFHVKNLVLTTNSHIAIRQGVKRSNVQFNVDCPSVIPISYVTRQ